MNKIFDIILTSVAISAFIAFCFALAKAVTNQDDI